MQTSFWDISEMKWKNTKSCFIDFKEWSLTAKNQNVLVLEFVKLVLEANHQYSYSKILKASSLLALEGWVGLLNLIFLIQCNLFSKNAAKRGRSGKW